jgi:hypothetical protein
VITVHPKTSPAAIGHGPAGQGLERPLNRTEIQNYRLFALLLRQFRVFIGSTKLLNRFEFTLNVRRRCMTDGTMASPAMITVNAWWIFFRDQERRQFIP